MDGQSKHDDLVDLVYEAALDADLWRPVLEGFADLIGAESARLAWENLTARTGTVLTARTDPAAIDVYFRYFAARSPLWPSGATVRLEPRAWASRIIRDDEIMPKEAFLKTEYYNDFFKTFDWHASMSMGLVKVGAESGSLAFYASERRGRFSDADVAMCASLQPHLARAFNLGRKFAETHGLTKTLSEVLDASPHGLVVLDADGRVRHVNRAAERLIANADGLAVIGGRLIAGGRQAARRLEVLIAAAIAPDGARRTGGSMALPTPTRRLPLSIIVAPVRSQRQIPFGVPNGAVVCITDLDAGLSLPEQRLRDLFGLSRAESRVALTLFEGLEPRQAAERLGVSFYTVRGHLVRIFDKTGTAGQVALARLMMRTVGAGLG